jgi:hypothetical protein
MIVQAEAVVCWKALFLGRGVTWFIVFVAFRGINISPWPILNCNVMSLSMDLGELCIICSPQEHTPVEPSTPHVK